MGNSVRSKADEDREVFERLRREDEESRIPEDPDNLDDRLTTGMLMIDDDDVVEAEGIPRDPHSYFTRERKLES